MDDSDQDRWLLPRRQTEYPAWDVLPEERLHGRREATFLALATIFVVTSVLLVVFGASRIIDPSDVLAQVRPDLAFPIAMQIPFGVLPFALGCLALTLVCELYGRRRAAVLAGIGLVAMLALAGLMRLAEQLDGSAALFGPALGFASGYLVLQLIYVPLFDAMRWRMSGRHLWLRLIVLSLVAQIAGWAVFGAATYAYASIVSPDSPVDSAAIIALATGSALYTLAVIALLTLPVALIARGLALFLRVSRNHEDDDGYDDDYDHRERPAEPVDLRRPAEPVDLRRRRLPKAQIVDDEDAVPEGQIVEERAGLEPSQRRRRAVASVQPFSSAEMRFFQEGDQLAEPTDS